MRTSRLPTTSTAATRAAAAVTQRRRTGAGGDPTPAAIPPAPLVLDRYRLVRRLGAGAFGSVWMALDERLERPVAVKILARERVDGRFEREARVAARLSHPAIVTLYEAAVDDEGAYLVSELVLGATLGVLLDADRLSDRDIVAIGIALCDALAHAHAQSVVHRDVKPSNILVPDAPVSASEVAKLTDFGIARLLGDGALTQPGEVLGTVAYMAPEQAAGREVTAAADLYSLALVLYEALSGFNPVASGAAARRARRLGVHLPPLARERADLPGALTAAIDTALRPDPHDRGTTGDLRARLLDARDRVLDEPPLIDEPPPGARRRPFSSRQEPAPPHGLAQPPAAPAPPPPPVPAAPAAPPAPATEVWPPRALAAVCAGALCAWCASHLLAPGTVAPGVAGVIAAAAVLLLPRLGWAAAVFALAAAAAAGGRPGAALVALAAGMAPVLVLPARRHAWPLAAAAPALGLLGLAGAWPALAARASTVWSRAMLGALGWLWLLLASAIAGRGLYLPLAPGSVATRGWSGSVTVTVDHVLRPMVAQGALAPAAVWALAAVVAPWLVGGRVRVLNIVRGVLWAALIPVGTAAVLTAAHGTGRLDAAPTAVVGALASAVVLLAPLALAGWGEALRSPESAPGVP
jgi:hypothetical protein